MSSRPCPRPRPYPGPQPGVEGTPLPVSVRPILVQRATEAGPVPVRTAGRYLDVRRVARRHPRATQRGGFVALFAAITAFVLTGASGPVSGAVAERPAPRIVTPTTQPTVVPMPAGAALAVPVLPAAKTDRHRTPTRGQGRAPVDHGVISALAANGIPQVALNAYRVAAARMANVDPSCGVPWYLLAGIGREESDHGRFGGAVLHADGVSTPKIIGPALDGKHWDFIPAPGNGLALDGDAKYAHALGPMQFIPSTWADYGADANGDGVADIFNINDAALGTARYLCAAGGDLHGVAGQTRAVLTYNHNDQYLAQVLALADAYRKGIAITGIPVGITKGSLPTVVDTGYIPPANPASPTASDPTAKKSAPRRGASSSGRTSGATSSAPSSGHPTSTAPTRGTSTTPTPSPSPTKSAPSKTSPSPTPTKTCSPLEQVLGCVPS